MTETAEDLRGSSGVGGALPLTEVRPKPDVVAGAGHPIAQETEAGDQRLRVNLGYKARPISQ